jgi:hypothetical protein
MYIREFLCTTVVVATCTLILPWKAEHDGIVSYNPMDISSSVVGGSGWSTLSKSSTNEMLRKCIAMLCVLLLACHLTEGTFSFVCFGMLKSH